MSTKTQNHTETYLTVRGVSTDVSYVDDRGVKHHVRTASGRYPTTDQGLDAALSARDDLVGYDPNGLWEYNVVRVSVMTTVETSEEIVTL